MENIENQMNELLKQQKDLEKKINIQNYFIGNFKEIIIGPLKINGQNADKDLIKLIQNREIQCLLKLLIENNNLGEINDKI